MSIRKRTSGLLADLAADGACTLGQAIRNRGSEALDSVLRNGLARVVPVAYRPTARSRRRVDAPVLMLTGAGEEAVRLEGLEPWRPPMRKIAHTLGMSELRAVLGLDPWSVVRGSDLEVAWVKAGVSRHGVPDGLFCAGGEMVGLEYDHGKYSAEQVEAKLEAAPLLSDRLVWGVPSAARAAWLRSRGVLDVLVLRIPLWPGVEL
jgi:hypothetical protein